MHFEDIVAERFKFLISEKGFSGPEIISDRHQKRILFKKHRLLVEMTSSYDIGFEIKLKTKNKKSDQGILIFSNPPGNTDKEFKFLHDAVSKVKSIIG